MPLSEFPTVVNAFAPCFANPGSEEKLAWLAARAALRLPLFEDSNVEDSNVEDSNVAALRPTQSASGSFVTVTARREGQRDAAANFAAI
jgi:hypothetical protein